MTTPNMSIAALVESLDLAVTRPAKITGGMATSHAVAPAVMMIRSECGITEHEECGKSVSNDSSTSPDAPSRPLGISLRPPGPLPPYGDSEDRADAGFSWVIHGCFDVEAMELNHTEVELLFFNEYFDNCKGAQRFRKTSGVELPPEVAHRNMAGTRRNPPVRASKKVKQERRREINKQKSV